MLMAEDTCKYMSRGLFNVSRLVNIADGGNICNMYSYMKMSHHAFSVEIFSLQGIDKCSYLLIKIRKTPKFMSVSASVFLSSVSATAWCSSAI